MAQNSREDEASCFVGADGAILVSKYHPCHYPQGSWSQSYLSDRFPRGAVSIAAKREGRRTRGPDLQNLPESTVIEWVR